MKPAVVLMVTLLGVSCTSSSQVASATPSANAPSTTAASPSPPPAQPCQPATSFGLIIANASLQVIDTCGKLKASAPIAPSSVQTCSPGGLAGQLEPPVSATSDRVYFRDGDTRIRYLTPDGQLGDATTVQGSASVVSSFSVSPDDSRIAVVVEDLSPPTAINLRLYVEDVQGGGHHADIYTTTVQKDGGSTLWPMGWTEGQLILAVKPACSDTAGGDAPSEWHVVNPATADRLATIPPPPSQIFGGACTLGRWPSPAGAACGNHMAINRYDWTAKLTGIYHEPPLNGLGVTFGNVIELSPSGDLHFQTVNQGILVEGNGIGAWTAPANACLWIDEQHILAPDSVIDLLGPRPISNPQNTVVRSLAVAGTCVGRFPGTL